MKWKRTLVRRVSSAKTALSFGVTALQSIQSFVKDFMRAGVDMSRSLAGSIHLAVYLYQNLSCLACCPSALARPFITCTEMLRCLRDGAVFLYPLFGNPPKK